MNPEDIQDAEDIPEPYRPEDPNDYDSQQDAAEERGW